MITIIQSIHPTARRGYAAVIFGSQSEPAIYVPSHHEGFPIYKKFADAAAQLKPGLLVEARETRQGAWDASDKNAAPIMVLHETE